MDEFFSHLTESHIQSLPSLLLAAWRANIEDAGWGSTLPALEAMQEAQD